jgi:hypothetical protein
MNLYLCKKTIDNVTMLVMIGVTITFMIAFAVALKIYNLG